MATRVVTTMICDHPDCTIEDTEESRTITSTEVWGRHLDLCPGHHAQLIAPLRDVLTAAGRRGKRAAGARTMIRAIG